MYIVYDQWDVLTYKISIENREHQIKKIGSGKSTTDDHLKHTNMKCVLHSYIPISPQTMYLNEFRRLSILVDRTLELDTTETYA